MREPIKAVVLILTLMLAVAFTAQAQQDTAWEPTAGEDSSDAAIHCSRAVGIGGRGHGLRARHRLAMEELTRAAKRAGMRSPQFDLGFMYATGFGDFEADRAEALTWYRRAAEQGFAQAQSAWAVRIRAATSWKQDFTQAATWCRAWGRTG